MMPAQRERPLVFPPGNLVIRQPQNAYELEAANRLVEIEYQRREYVQTLEPFRGDKVVTFVAVTETGEVVAAISVQQGRAGEEYLPTERYFKGFRTDDKWKKRTPPKIAEIGRLACPKGPWHKGALLGLLVAAQRWCEAHDVLIAIASLKPALGRLLNGYGIPNWEVRGSECLDPSAVPPQYHPYFFTPKMAERPVAVAITLTRSARAITRHQRQLEQSGKVHFLLADVHLVTASGS